MGMFTSTRDTSILKTPSQALLEGLSREGGLYVLKNFDEVKLPLDEMSQMSYYQLATTVLSQFLTDFTKEEIEECVKRAYSRFPSEEVTPVKKLTDGYVLELFHGPTSAFKDVALQLLPQLMRVARKKCGYDGDVLILTATSGDTGKAALEGFCDVEGTQIVVFYPKDGTSVVQELQMITQPGNNTHVASVNGNFDICQSSIKRLMSDPSFRNGMEEKGILLSSANSINIGRLLPQMVYYFYSYYQLVREGEFNNGQTVDFVVPTGNFGDILAGYYAKKLGLPVRHLICASNANKILTDFLTTGIYDRRRDFYLTSSPSMDILVSSNLERLLYDVCDGNSEMVKGWMSQLATQGYYELPKEYLEKIQETFLAGCCDDDATQATIQDIWYRDHYLLDPHSAVAYHVMNELKNDETPCVSLATASPYKFSKTVYHSIYMQQNIEEEFSLMRQLQAYTNTTIPYNLAQLERMPIVHNTNLNPDEIEGWVNGLMEG